MLTRADCDAILTAGGASSRMGQPKALLDWGGVPLVRHQVDALAGFGRVVVVLGADADAIARGLGPVGDAGVVVVNHRWAEGRSTSLEAGAAAVRGAARAVLVAAVDQPLVPEVIDALLAGLDPEGHAYAVPSRQGRRGHPILLSGRLAADLRHASDLPEGLRSLVRAHAGASLSVEVPAAVIHRDLNTPEAYAAARRSEDDAT